METGAQLRWYLLTSVVVTAAVILIMARLWIAALAAFAVATVIAGHGVHRNFRA